MVRRALEECGVNSEQIWIVPVPDVHLHMMWVSSVEGYTPHFDVVYSNEPLTRRLFMESGYKVKSIRLFDRKDYSSTEIREKMVKGENWEKLVPKSVVAFIEEVDGVNRLKDIIKTDKV